MVGNSKILTVSYGTFSCTLEGFDDPFSTMKDIAEYFQGLASSDRFFGAEPPTPDAAMLAQIAQRTASDTVSAEYSDDNTLTLRNAPTTEPVATLGDDEVVTPDEDSSFAEKALIAAGAAAAGAAAASALSSDDEEENGSELVDETAAIDASDDDSANAEDAPEEETADEKESVAEEVSEEPEAGTAEAVVNNSAEEMANAPKDEVEADSPASDDAEAKADDTETDAASADENAEEDKSDVTDKALIAGGLTAAALAAAAAIGAEDEEKAETDASVAAEEDADQVLEDTLAALLDEEPKVEAAVEEPKAGTAEEMSDAEENPADDDQTLEDTLASLLGDTSAEAEPEQDTAPEARAEADDQQLEDTIAALLGDDVVEQSEQKAEPEAAEDSVETLEAEETSDDDLATLISDIEAEEESRDAPEAQTPVAEADEAKNTESFVEEMTEAQGPALDDEAIILEKPVADATPEEEASALKAEEKTDPAEAEAAPVPAIVAPEENTNDAAEGSQKRPIVLVRKSRKDQMPEAAVPAAQVVEDSLPPAGDDAMLAPEDEAELQAELTAIEAEVRATRQAGSEALPPAADDDAAALDRLFQDTDARLKDADNSTRHAHIASLRAAVAAQKADDTPRDAAAEEEAVRSAYREDLASVMKPKTTVDQEKTPEGNPLVLVAEQRIPGEDDSEEPALDALNEDPDSFVFYSQSRGAASGEELLEAAAAYTMEQNGTETFSRPEIMRLAASQDAGFTREDGLRSFGTLLREGRIVKVGRGTFRLAENASGDAPQQSAAS